MAFLDGHFMMLLAGLLLLWQAAGEEQLLFTIDEVTLTLVPGAEVKTGTNVTLRCQIDISHSSTQHLVHSFRFLLNQDQVLYTRNSSNNQVEFSFTPARAANSGGYTCHVRVLEKEKSSQEQMLTVTGLMTPVLTVTPRVIYEGQDVTVSCLAPKEAGKLIFHLYVNNQYNRQFTSTPPGGQVEIKLTKPGVMLIHCKTTLLSIYLAGTSNISNVVNVTVRELEVTPTISFSPPSNVIEGDFLTVECSLPNFLTLPDTVQKQLELFLTKDGRLLKQERRRQKCRILIRAVAADSGTYVCKAENVNVQKTTSGTVSVAPLFSRPEVTVHPPVVFEGDNFTVSCSILSVALRRINLTNITYRLFRNQMQLQHGQRYTAAAGSPHDGGYFCQAEAKEIVKNSTEIIVKAKMLPSTPLISVEGGVIIGRPFQVLCRTGRGSLPITFSLMKGQRSLGSQEVYGLSALFNASAIGKKAELEELSCHAQNDASRPRITGMPLQAPVIEPVFMVTLTVEPWGGEITEGLDLKLTCSIHQGSPPLTFTFGRSLQGALESKQQHLKTLEANGNRVSYTIRAIDRAQAGQYQCHAANKANQRSSPLKYIHVKLAPWKVALMTVCVILLVAGVGVALLILIKRSNNPCNRTRRAGELSVKPAKTKSNDPQRVSLVLEEQPAPNATPGMLGRSVWSDHISGSGSDSESQSEDDPSGEVQYSQVVHPPQIDTPTTTTTQTAPLTNGTETEHSEVRTTNADSPTQTEGTSVEYAQLNHGNPEPE